MNKDVFKSDPFLGFTFDASELVRVNNYEGYTVGDKVSFLGLCKIGSTEREVITGELIAIGINAKYADGTKFVAVIIEEKPGVLYFRNLEKLTKM